MPNNTENKQRFINIGLATIGAGFLIFDLCTPGESTLYQAAVLISLIGIILNDSFNT